MTLRGTVVFATMLGSVGIVEESGAETLGVQMSTAISGYPIYAAFL